MDIKSYKDIVYNIIGAAMTVHKELGYGLQEGIYNESLCMELHDRHINAESEVELLCYYKGRQLQKKYRMDVVVGDIIVELKSVSKILEEHGAQLFNYLSIRDSYGQECPVIDRNLSEIFIYDYSRHIHGYS